MPQLWNKLSLLELSHDTFGKVMGSSIHLKDPTRLHFIIFMPGAVPHLNRFAWIKRLMQFDQKRTANECRPSYHALSDDALIRSQQEVREG